jgi:hypothetical protein
MDKVGRKEKEKKNKKGGGKEKIIRRKKAKKQEKRKGRGIMDISSSYLCYIAKIKLFRQTFF